VSNNVVAEVDFLVPHGREKGPEQEPMGTRQRDWGQDVRVLIGACSKAEKED